MNTDLMLLKEFFPEVTEIRNSQKTELRQIVDEREKENNVVLLYLFEQTNSAWSDIDFSLRLLVYEEIEHFALPVRAAFDKVLKLMYLSHQSENKREKLCRKEFLKMASLFYSISSSDSERKGYIKSFEDFNTLGLDITDKIRAFPPTRSMIEKAFPDEAEKLWHIYSDLSEHSHGNILFAFRKNNYVKSGLNMLVRFSFELIKLSDWHLNGEPLSPEIVEFIEKWNKKFGE